MESSTENPIYERFFKGKGQLSSKFNETPQMFLFKKQLLAEKYLAQTQVSSAPFFTAKGNYFLMHNISLLDQSAVHKTIHAKSAMKSKNLASNVAGTFNKLMKVVLTK